MATFACYLYSKGVSVIQCYLCDSVFNTAKILQTHLENLEAFLKVFCKRCKIFIRIEDAVLHSDITYSCTLCKLILPKQNFLSHECLHESSSQDIAMERREVCDICEKFFFHENDMKSHIMERHSSASRNFCKCCNILFKNVVDYLKHITDHGTNVTVPVQFQLYRCRFCNDEFHKKKSLSMHTRMVHEYKAAEAIPNKKGRHVKNNTIFTIITRINSAKRTIKNMCYACNKHFKSARMLVTHKRKQHRARIFKCSRCHRYFKTKILRDEHIKSHRLRLRRK
ncbi:hypothetical protein NQ314_018753 [Rhamnusium bicolor]|uniref:C2H2-type domain-containing protein n=1 Tax=Rhamnusium bicolor TaxID=1586634 RepID=A0AAV8WPJ3_9CUCU|nr:hypothetical protein NQ314_018753 [Rhamnusium bicolor]